VDDERRAQLTALLEGARGSRAIKAAGRLLDGRDPSWREDLAALAAERGVALPAEAAGWRGKRLVRRALGREGEARRRANPVRRDEPFNCAACGLDVPPGGARVRDHCPACLASLHLDVVPGDRAAGCGGLMRPEGLEILRGEAILRYRCARCGAARRCRAHPGDDAAALAAVSARAL